MTEPAAPSRVPAPRRPAHLSDPHHRPARTPPRSCSRDHRPAGHPAQPRLPDGPAGDATDPGPPSSPWPTAAATRAPCAPSRALLDRVRELRPGLPVHLGHIELNEPLLPDTLAALGDRRERRPRPAAARPRLPRQAGHPRDGRRRAPALRTRVAAPLGPHPLLVEALHARLVEAGWRTPTDGDPPQRRGRPGRRRLPRPRRRPSDTRRTAAPARERLGGVPGRARRTPPPPRPPSPDAVRALAARGRAPGRRRLVLHRPRPLRHRSAPRPRPGSPPPRSARTRRWPGCCCTATTRPCAPAPATRR